MSAGAIAELRRYPVKSMDGETLERTAVGPAGLLGDRAWALVDRATGKRLSAKRWAKLMLCRSRYADEPARSRVPPAEVTLPDGASARTDEPRCASLLSRFLGVDCAPALAPGEFFDDLPVHLLTNASLRSMKAREPLDFDARRFRPNILVASGVDGFPETAWIGKTIAIGGLAFEVRKAVKRCVMTTLPGPGLKEEKGVLPAVVAAGGALGVYAVPLGEGELRVGDALEIISLL